MAYRLGCELADSIAAIAPVAGALSVESCFPSEPVPIMVFHGTKDAFIKYEGGPSAAAKDKRIDTSVEDAISLWVKHNHCQSKPERVDKGAVITEYYRDCDQGAAVVLHTIIEGGHAWPGGRKGWWFGAEPTSEISASGLMWEFFSRHAKQ